MPQVRQYGNCCVMLRCLSFWLGTTWKLQNVVGSKVQYYSITAIVTVSSAVNAALLPQNLLPKMKGTHASKSPRLLGHTPQCCRACTELLLLPVCKRSPGSAVFFGSHNPWTELKSWRGQRCLQPLVGPHGKWSISAGDSATPLNHSASRVCTPRAHVSSIALLTPREKCRG